MKKISIDSALVLAGGTCGPETCVYGPDNCPRYWRRVFILYFGNEPLNDKDPRWDILFRIGYPARKELVTKQKQEKAAS